MKNEKDSSENRKAAILYKISFILYAIIIFVAIYGFFAKGGWPISTPEGLEGSFVEVLLFFFVFGPIMIPFVNSLYNISNFL